MLPVITSPASALELLLTPGGSLEIHSGPQTQALENASAQLLTASGTPYAVSVFSPDSMLYLSQPVRRFDNVAPGSYRLVVAGGVSRPVEIAEGTVTSVALP